MLQLTSTKGTLQVKDDWLPPNDPNFKPAVGIDGDETDEAIVEGEAKMVTRRTGTINDERELTFWVEYWLDIGGENPELIHRSAHVNVKSTAEAKSDVGTF